MRKIYLAVGSLLVVLGIAGFVVPNALAGVVDVNALGTIVHLASGVIALVVATTQGVGALRTWGRVLGFFYLGLAAVGMAGPDLFGLAPSVPTNLLHLAVALPFLYVSLLAPPRL
jgi:hypothetical protein